MHAYWTHESCMKISSWKIFGHPLQPKTVPSIRDIIEGQQHPPQSHVSPNLDFRQASSLLPSNASLWTFSVLRSRCFYFPATSFRFPYGSVSTPSALAQSVPCHLSSRRRASITESRTGQIISRTGCSSDLSLKLEDRPSQD